MNNKKENIMKINNMFNISAGTIIGDDNIVAEIIPAVDSNQKLFKIKVLKVNAKHLGLEADREYYVFSHEGNSNCQVWEVAFSDAEEELQCLLFWFPETGWSWGK